MEAARSFGRIRDDLSMNVAAVARFVGLEYQYVLGMMRLLELHPDLQKMVEKREIGASVGKALAGIEMARQATVLLHVKSTGPVTSTRVKTAIEALLNGEPESRNPHFRKRSRAPSDFREILERALRRTAIQFSDMPAEAIESAVTSGISRGTLDYDGLVVQGVRAAKSLFGSLAAIPGDEKATLERALVSLLADGLTGILDLPEGYYAGLARPYAAELRGALERIEKVLCPALAELRKRDAPAPQPLSVAAVKPQRPAAAVPPPPQRPQSAAHARPPHGNGSAQPRASQQTAKKPGKPGKPLAGGLGGAPRRRS